MPWAHHDLLGRLLRLAVATGIQWSFSASLEPRPVIEWLPEKGAAFQFQIPGFAGAGGPSRNVETLQGPPPIQRPTRVRDRLLDRR